MRTIYQTLVVGFLLAVSCGGTAAANAPTPTTTGTKALDLPCNPLVCSVKGP
jgi:hypothetical protein